MTLFVKDWKRFQHFKDRKPPWIKLYREILDDPDWHELSGDNAKILVSLWLIASEDDTHSGMLPCTRKLAFRLRVKESQLNKALTELSHWLIQDDINMISSRYQLDAPETETERETERETDTFAPSDKSLSAADKKINFDYKLGQWDGIEVKDARGWELAYPALDIETELFKAAEWVKANPANRKSNWRRFLTNWFSRAQERAPRVSK